MSFIEFDYVLENGKPVLVEGTKDGLNVTFKVLQSDGSVLKESLLSPLDLEHIADFIYENSVEEIEFESDFYDRSSD